MLVEINKPKFEKLQSSDMYFSFYSNLEVAPTELAIAWGGWFFYKKGTPMVFEKFVSLIQTRASKDVFLFEPHLNLPQWGRLGK